ncbi:hypothetical protein U1Q18_040456, partial [Sarracenia purpurea var. burkii]
MNRSKYQVKNKYQTRRVLSNRSQDVETGRFVVSPNKFQTLSLVTDNYEETFPPLSGSSSKVQKIVSFRDQIFIDAAEVNICLSKMVSDFPLDLSSRNLASWVVKDFEEHVKDASTDSASRVSLEERVYCLKGLSPLQIVEGLKLTFCEDKPVCVVEDRALASDRGQATNLQSKGDLETEAKQGTVSSSDNGEEDENSGIENGTVVVKEVDSEKEDTTGERAGSPPLVGLDKNFENNSGSIEEASFGANDSYDSSVEDDVDSDKGESENEEDSEGANVDEAAEGAMGCDVVPNSEAIEFGQDCDCASKVLASKHQPDGEETNRPCLGHEVKVSDELYKEDFEYESDENITKKCFRDPEALSLKAVDQKMFRTK